MSNNVEYGSINDPSSSAQHKEEEPIQQQQQQQQQQHEEQEENQEVSVDVLRIQQEQQEAAELADLPCCWWCPPLVRAVLVISFLVGVSNGCISPVVPGLQNSTFGNNSYEITGAFAGGKGALQTIYTPIITSFTDSSTTFGVLITVLTLSAVPFAVQLLTGNFWLYTSLDVVFGMYSLAFTLLIIVVSAQVPQINKGRTLALACNLAVFMLGIGAGSVIGPFVTEATCFALAVGIQLLTVIVTALFMRGLLEEDRPLLHCPIAEVAKKHLHDQQPKKGGRGEEDSQEGISPTATGAPQQCPFKHLHNQKSSSVAASSSSATTAAATTSGDNNNKQGEKEEPKEDGEVPSFDSSPLLNNNNNNNKNKSKTQILVIAGQRESAKGKFEDRSCFAHAKRSLALFASNFNVKALCLISFFNYLVVDMLSSLLLLYLQNSLGFNEDEQSNTIIIMAVANVVFVPFVLFTRTCLSDVNLLRSALLSSVVMCILYAVVKNKTFAVWLPVVNIFGLAAPVAVNSLIIDSVDGSEIGVGTGVVATARVAAGVICPFLYGEMFQVASDSSMPGWPMIVAAASICVGIVITLFLRVPT